ncbi:glutathione S-transferase family protein [Sphingorhabdus sp. EL138]|uniref:glutathione S-transferase family protein n=1 Tax=Sphingorhabdus sp. EL138 TaxID=2073156 RepID=UPI000D69EF9E|nr:glutathione S-transferase family protein [Sphingorhabdus sp. EL138]
MITLFGAVSPNVQKVAILLSELGLEYEIKLIDLERGEQSKAPFLRQSPNGRVPMIEDSATGASIWESGAILQYLCETYDTAGRLLPLSGHVRFEVLQYVFFQAANIGPALGHLNAQLSADADARVPAMRDKFLQEAIRLMGVLERLLEGGNHYLAGEYSIADIMHYPWLKPAFDMGFSAVTESVALSTWLNRIESRPAIKEGMQAFAM